MTSKNPASVVAFNAPRRVELPDVLAGPAARRNIEVYEQHGRKRADIRYSPERIRVTVPAPANNVDVAITVCRLIGEALIEEKDDPPSDDEIAEAGAMHRGGEMRDNYLHAPSARELKAVVSIYKLAMREHATPAPETAPPKRTRNPIAMRALRLAAFIAAMLAFHAIVGPI